MAINAGDIAFLGANADAPDEFSIIVRNAIAGGETFIVTDGGFISNTGVASTTFRSTEGFLQYTAPAAGLPAGTILVVTAGESVAANAAVARNGGGDAGSVTILPNSTPNTTNFSFSTSGDSLTAFTVSGGTHLTGAPTLIAFVNYGADGSGSDSPQTSAIPTIVGGQVLDLANADNFIVVNTTSAGTLSIADLSNAANFVQSETEHYDFTVISAGSSGPTGGDDALSGTTGDDTINLLAGNDSYDGDAGADTINGGLGNDTLTGGAGNDTFVQDTLDSAGAQADVITDFTLGEDKVAFASNGPASLGAVLAVVRRATTDATLDIYSDGDLNSLELDGLSRADFIANASADDFVFDVSGTPRSDDRSASLGNETIFGGTGNDTLSGGAGNDLLYGDGGDDQMTGGAGNDVYYVDSTGDVVTETAGQGTADTLWASIGFTLDDAQSIETLRAVIGTGGQVLNGNASNNTLIGNEGDDTLNGQGGNDVLSGLGGTNTLAGGLGNDRYVISVGTTSTTIIESDGEGTDTVQTSVDFVLTAGASVEAITARADANGIAITGNELTNRIQGSVGDDTLNGGAGNDALIGGTGNDVFEFNDGWGRDTIRDFVDGSDVLDLTGVSGLDTFDQLTIRQIGTRTLIVFEGNTISLADTTATNFTEGTDILINDLPV